MIIILCNSPAGFEPDSSVIEAFAKTNTPRLLGFLSYNIGCKISFVLLRVNNTGQGVVLKDKLSQKDCEMERKHRKCPLNLLNYVGCRIRLSG
jgi:hypothetical protein